MSRILDQKTVLVTGANRGIGRALVEGAIAQGAKKVYAAVRKLESAESLVKQYGNQVVPIRVDLNDQQSILEAAKVASDVEVLINNAGVLSNDPLLSANFAQSLDDALKTNVYGFVAIAQAFAPVLKANGGGVLVQLNSVVSLKSFASFAAYSASKAASYSITQALREELTPQGTLVISIHPGPIATDMGREAGFEEIAEPASVVADALWTAIQEQRFHVFPDAMARQFGEAYQSFATNVVEPLSSESLA